VSDSQRDAVTKLKSLPCYRQLASNVTVALLQEPRELHIQYWSVSVKIMTEKSMQKRFDFAACWGWGPKCLGGSHHTTDKKKAQPKDEEGEHQGGTGIPVAERIIQFIL